MCQSIHHYCTIEGTKLTKKYFVCMYKQRVAINPNCRWLYAKHSTGVEFRTTKLCVTSQVRRFENMWSKNWAKFQPLAIDIQKYH